MTTSVFAMVRVSKERRSKVTEGRKTKCSPSKGATAPPKPICHVTKTQ